VNHLLEAEHVGPQDQVRVLIRRRSKLRQSWRSQMLQFQNSTRELDAACAAPQYAAKYDRKLVQN